MKKTIVFMSILTAITILPCFLNKTFALAENDCDTIFLNTTIFGSRTGNNNKPINFANAYPVDSINRAIGNLTAYCCKDILKQGKTPDARCDQAFLPTSNYPESPYLFDHLVDVGLRRLDVLGNYEDVAPDKIGLEWRLGPGKDNRPGIQQIATSAEPKATEAMEIIKAYKKYRTLDKKWMFKKIHLKVENMDTAELGKLKEFLDAYNTEISLADKYNNLCRIARNIYEKKPGGKISIGGDKLSKGRSYYTDCQKMVANRIYQENVYVKAILTDKAAEMLKNNLVAVLNKQFVQDKLAGVQKSISMIRDLFQTLVRQAPYCKKCSK